MPQGRLPTVDRTTAALRRGFTLIELLVVIAIIGVLVGLLLPAVQQAREAARRNACGNNMKQIGLAMHNYADAHREHLPTGWVCDPSEDHGDEGLGWGWASQILMHLEEAAVYDDIDFRQQIAHASNTAARTAVIRTFLCPSDPLSAEPVFFPGDDGSGDNDEHDDPDHTPGTMQFSRSTYPGMFGAEHMHEEGPPEEHHALEGDGVFFGNSKVAFRHIKDGLSKTIAVGERDGRLGGSLWIGMVEGKCAAPGRVVGPGEHMFNSGDPHFDDFYSQHPSGMNVVFADGHVAFLHDSLTEAIFQALATRAGGEVVAGDY
jgi:prepilin-type N-terminal cleavage/methylation domain-containing protein/prepilin-type processing-associated H-X9-DG protein